MNDGLQNRRPLKVRNQGWAKMFAATLSKSNITPNQISILSMVFAAMGLGSGYAAGQTDSLPEKIILVLSLAVFVQLRLVCNLMDGMVAVEGAKKTPAGEIFNDAPDRIADVFFLMGAGLIAGTSSPMVHWAWAASAFAILTAYVRVLGTSVGLPADFSGPMAKQHRMFLITAGSLVTGAELYLHSGTKTLLYTLMIITLGSAYTSWKRISRIYSLLMNRGNPE